MAEDAFFERLGDDAWRASPSTRGPWSDRHQHGGPPSALLARAMEARAEEAGVPTIVRFTIELLRPIPIDAVETRVRVVGEGRTVRRLEGSLVVAGAEVARAVALFAATRPIDVDLATTTPPLAPPASAAAMTFPFFAWDVGYHTAMEGRLVRGGFGQARTAAWLRMKIPLVAGETPSPAQRVLVAADSGNGVTAALDTRAWSFVNPDLTVYLQRPAEGEWIGLDAEMRVERSGLGLADTVLHDARGVVGRGVQSLVVRSVAPSA